MLDEKTNQVEEISAFLNACYDAEEQIAQAAFERDARWVQGAADSEHGLAGVWQTSGLGSDGRCNESAAGVPNFCDDQLIAVFDDFHGGHAARAAHMVLRDPAATLADLKVKRRIIADVVKILDDLNDFVRDNASAAAHPARPGEWMQGENEPEMYLLRLMASLYSDREGFKPEWALT